MEQPWRYRGAHVEGINDVVWSPWISDIRLSSGQYDVT